MNNIELVEYGIKMGWMTKPIEKPIEFRHKLTPSQILELLAMRRAGQSLKNIAEHYQMHTQTIGSICDVNHVEPL